MTRFRLTLPLYLLSLPVRPFVATLAVTLLALLLERMLRLLDLITDSGADPTAVLRVLADLVPHYLGLALPAALFLGIYFAVARLGRDGELEAMGALGVSLGRIGRWYMAVAAVAAGLAALLYGYGQPLARYAYRADFQAVLERGWNATVPAGEITRVSSGLVLTADTLDPGSGTLGRVLVFRRARDGREEVTTGRTGTLELSDDGTRLFLRMDGARQLSVGANEAPRTLGAGSTTMSRPFTVQIAAFRPRGVDEREMTLDELWTAAHAAAAPAVARPRLLGEFHGRVVRALSLAVLPLLAVPVGLAARRTRRQYGAVTGMAVLVLYDHAIQMAQSFGGAGRLPPEPALWGALAAFAAFGAWLFHRARRATGGQPFERLFAFLDGLVEAALRRRAAPAAGGRA